MKTILKAAISVGLSVLAASAASAQTTVRFYTEAPQTYYSAVEQPRYAAQYLGDPDAYVQQWQAQREWQARREWRERREQQLRREQWQREQQIRREQWQREQEWKRSHWQHDDHDRGDWQREQWLRDTRNIEGRD